MQIENNQIENPNWQGATSWIIPSQRIYLGRPKTNPSNGQSRTWTGDNRTVILMCWPLGHVLQK